jgi:hypothetical protein
VNGDNRDDSSPGAEARIEPQVRQAEERSRRTAEEPTRRHLARFARDVGTCETPSAPQVRLQKLSAFAGDEWVPNAYIPAWWQEGTTGPSRIVAAVSDDQIATALRLAACGSEPFLLLWVLHAPRAGSKRGRYQSPPICFREVEHLLLKYRALFEQDARSDIWIHAEAPDFTVVLDQHDRIYAYGPAEAFVSRLEGFQNARTAIPSPHAHNYHAEFDDLERMFASEFDWNFTDLEPEDDP